MPRPPLLPAFLLALLASLPYLATAQTIFRDGMETPFSLPASDAEAARFLNQATFGATPQSIAEVRASGIEVWLRRQTSLPATLARPFLESITAAENIAGSDLSQTHRIQRWLDTAVTAPDQLRQKVAWALGQMIVVSDQDAGLGGEEIMMAEWNDLLVRNALGNYRTLLGEVVRSPMMGRYLSHLRNRKFEITPRCWDQRPDSQGRFDHRATADPPYHDCSSSDATNNGTMEPRIAVYLLPGSGMVAPDENFAREVMQLFSIGLIERNLDFTPFPSASQPQPTYDQQTIVTLSRVLTGLSYRCSGDRVVAGRTIARNCNCSGVDCQFSSSLFFSTPPSLNINGRSGLVHPDRYEPMVCYPRYHDTGRDRTGFQLPGLAGTWPVGARIDLAPGQEIPGGTPPAAKVLELGGTPMLTLPEIAPGQPRSPGHCDNPNASAAEKAACIAYCDSSLEAAIDLLFHEPNTAAMVARHLIQRLVTSNPSPDYIRRVAQTFVDNGRGVRGDLAAVVRAVLLDREAREPVADSGSLAFRGKPREPLLKLVQIWRSIGAVSSDTRPDGYRRWARTRCSGSGSWPQCAYEQRPLGSPTVFNFYEPDYQAPGPISELGLYSPELQIINEASAVLTANDLYTQICAGWGSGNNCHGAFGTPPSGRAYFPPAVLDALPGGRCGTACTGADDAALIAALDVRLFGGTMSGQLGDPAHPDSPANTGMKGILLRFLQQTISGSMGESDPQNARRREILYLLHLIAASPEFATQR
ncbi:MAG: hypothetical protein KatS3mg126_1550 [Lysobacteraceae bacterium]|nr:MAG: hypothetical protein KatS3mg126_1550 [Xanthomonadaceae bacterium]